MQNQTVKKKAKLEIHWPITIVCVALLFIAVIFLAVKPDRTSEIITNVFNAVMSGGGPFLLLFDALLVIICFVIALTPFGKIKLGEGDPEYSMFSYVAMMMCAALASASMFWSFTEWAYYVDSPGLNVEAYSQESYEIAMGYSFFHWGFLAQCVYVAIGLVTAYALYVRKMDTLKMSTIAEEMMGGFKGKKVIGRIIDILVIFCTLGGLGVSLGLGVPVIAGGIYSVTGIDVTFAMQVGIVIVLTIIFSWSSFVGTGRGMKFLSDNTVKVLIAFIAFIFIFGPTSFIQKMFVSSLGQMVSNMPRMATFTDPITNGGFAEAWTIFFIAFPMTYAGLMGIFVAKISKGRSIRCLVFACMFGISVGTWIFFGINGGLAMERELSGEFSMINEVVNGDPYAGVFTLLNTLPLGKILAVVYIICVAGFICTTMDTASLCLASTTIKTLDKDNNPSKISRLFWCIMLALLPLALMFSGADFDIFKSLAILVSTPLAIVLLFMCIGVFRWMREDIKTPGKLIYVKSNFVDLNKDREE